MSNKILQIIIEGLIMGGIYALISMGLTMQYGVARILNVSHGEFIMVGAFITWMLTTMAGISPLIALLLCVPATFLIGYILHRTLYKKLKDLTPSPGAYEGNAMLVSFGLMFIIQSVAQKIWGSSPQGYKFLAFSFKIGNTSIAVNRLFVLLFAVVISVIFYIFLNRTRMGKAIRASSQDSVAAGMMGIKINSVISTTFIIGSFLAAVGSLLYFTNYATVTPISGAMPGLKAFVAAVFGGIGSVPGAVVGAFIIGICENIMKINELNMTTFSDAFTFALLIIILIAKPTGLFGEKTTDKV